MAVTETEIKELDVVEITTPIGRWPVGTRGAVVGIYGGYMDVDIAADGGRMLDLLVVPENQLRLAPRSSS